MTTKTNAAQTANDPLNRATPHPTQPTAHCTLVRIAGDKHLVGLCPTCKLPIAHEPVRDVPLNYYSKRTCCHACSGYWITMQAEPDNPLLEYTWPWAPWKKPLKSRTKSKTKP